MKFWTAVWLFCAGLLVGVWLSHVKMQPVIDDLTFQLEICKSHNEFLENSYNMERMSWKEYWRKKCGCFTTDEIMAALTGGRYNVSPRTSEGSGD